MILPVATLQNEGATVCRDQRAGGGREGLGGYRRGVRSPGTEPTPADLKGVREGLEEILCIINQKQ